MMMILSAYFIVLAVAKAKYVLQIQDRLLQIRQEKNYHSFQENIRRLITFLHSSNSFVQARMRIL